MNYREFEVFWADFDPKNRYDLETKFFVRHLFILLKQIYGQQRF